MNKIKQHLTILNSFLQNKNKFALIKYNNVSYGVLKILYEYRYLQNIQNYKINKINYVLVEFKHKYTLEKLKFKLNFIGFYKSNLYYNSPLIILSTNSGIMSKFKADLIGIKGIVLCYVS